MSGPDRLLLHLGAHKTASTHFNEVIDLNRAALVAAGVQSVHKKELRSSLSDAMRAVACGLPESIQWAETRSCHASASTLLLSEELILGFARDAGPYGGLYPDAPKRLSLAFRVLGATMERTELMIAIRNPKTFFPSVWGESLRNRETPPFRTWLGSEPLGQPYWTRFLERLSNAAPGYRLTVWTYESYSSNPGAIASHLLDRVADIEVEIRHIPEIVRPGLSAHAIERIYAMRSAGSDPGRSEIEEIVARFPRGDDWPGFDPFTRAEREGLDAAYADDLERVAQLPCVRFVG